jgi:hypothetical protein
MLYLCAHSDQGAHSEIICATVSMSFRLRCDSKCSNVVVRCRRKRSSVQLHLTTFPGLKIQIGLGGHLLQYP